jgi:hypothetical protein
MTENLFKQVKQKKKKKKKKKKQEHKSHKSQGNVKQETCAVCLEEKFLIPFHGDLAPTTTNKHAFCSECLCKKKDNGKDYELEFCPLCRIAEPGMQTRFHRLLREKEGKHLEPLKDLDEPLEREVELETHAGRECKECKVRFPVTHSRCFKCGNLFSEYSYRQKATAYCCRVSTNEESTTKYKGILLRFATMPPPCTCCYDEVAFNQYLFWDFHKGLYHIMPEGYYSSDISYPTTFPSLFQDKRTMKLCKDRSVKS